MSTTGERIRELRIRNKLTLDDVAKYLGVGRQAIYKYEHGTVTNIPLENIEKMAELFHVTPGYISGWSNGDAHQREINLQMFNSLEPDPQIRIVSGMMENMSDEQKEQIVAIVRAVVATQKK